MYVYDTSMIIHGNNWLGRGGGEVGPEEEEEDHLEEDDDDV